MLRVLQEKRWLDIESNRVFSHLNMIIAEKDRIIADKDDQICQLVNSRSYRYTAFLRQGLAICRHARERLVSTVSSVFDRGSQS